MLPDSEGLGGCDEEGHEAEARAPRMLPDDATRRAAHGRASTRPRRARLGCCLEASLSLWLTAPRHEAEARAPRMLPAGGNVRRGLDQLFTRPRRARLGCCLAASQGRAADRRAHEAEARAPRMLPALAREHVARQITHEAEARAPRMLPAIRKWWWRNATTIRGRGARASDAACARHAQTSWGEIRNEAEARAPRMLPARPCPSCRSSKSPHEAEARAPRMLPDGLCWGWASVIEKRGRGARASDAACRIAACGTRRRSPRGRGARASDAACRIALTHIAGRVETRPRRARLGCCLARAGDPGDRACHPRPRRARLGCCLGADYDREPGQRISEAEARAPRMLPFYHCRETRG